MTSTGSGVSRAIARTASARPRSASTGGWMPRTRSRSSVSAVAEVSRAWASSARAAAGSLSMQLLDGGQAHADGDQPGLRAVVQVAFDPAQLGGLGVDGVGPGLGQPAHPVGEHGRGRSGVSRRRSYAGPQAQQRSGEQEPDPPGPVRSGGSPSRAPRRAPGRRRSAAYHMYQGVTQTPVGQTDRHRPRRPPDRLPHQAEEPDADQDGGHDASRPTGALVTIHSRSRQVAGSLATQP